MDGRREKGGVLLNTHVVEGEGVKLGAQCQVTQDDSELI
jgi:hypothetical protein